MAPNLKLPKIDFRSPRFRNSAIIIACGIGGIVAWNIYVYQVRQAKIGELDTVMTEKQGELNSILAMKPQLEKLRVDIARANGQLDSLKSIFPDQKEIPKLIREITRIAYATGIETRKFSPLPDVQKEYYVENRYTMVIGGGYHQVAEFFSLLANLPLLVNLSEVALNASNKGGAQTAADQGEEDVESVSVSFKMTTFSSRR